MYKMQLENVIIFGKDQCYECKDVDTNLMILMG